MPTDDCIFCSIIAGNIPSYMLYEDEQTYAFLDINPVSDGHLLVIPKQHAETLTELDEAATTSLFTTVRNLVEAVETSLSPDGINILQNNGAAAGQEVGHVHVHVIPRYEHDGFEFSFTSTDLDEDTAATVSEHIKARIRH